MLRESLEPTVWAMAHAAKKLFEENLFSSNGEPVKVVLADTCIGRVPEAAACEDKFRKAGVSITLSVTSCWCYGSETMDMNPETIKGVWGFNGTERPGAVYLAAVLAGHAQKGLPTFGIYGHEVQDLDQVNAIPDDVKEKLLRFGRAAVAVATMRGKSYLQIGSQCMGMLMMRLLTHRAQIFADVRTYWSGEATERVTGYKLEGKAKESDGIIHLLVSKFLNGCII